MNHIRGGIGVRTSTKPIAASAARPSRLKEVGLLLAWLALSGCTTDLAQVLSAPDHALVQKARDLHWVIEGPTGTFIASATAFGPGRLITNAHGVENWIGLPLRVRQGSRTLPVRTMGLAVREDLAILHVAEQAIQTPHGTTRPQAGTPVLVAGATRHGAFHGAGSVSAPPAGVSEFGTYVIATIPSASGFSGAPVVNGDGDLVGIVSAAIIRRHIDPPNVQHESPYAVIDRRPTIIIPLDVIETVIRDEGL